MNNTALKSDYDSIEREFHHEFMGRFDLKHYETKQKKIPCVQWVVTKYISDEPTLCNVILDQEVMERSANATWDFLFFMTGLWVSEIVRSCRLSVLMLML